MRFLGIVALCATFLGAPGHAAAETIKLGTLAPEGSPWHNAIRDMAEAWREISDGRIDVRIYAGGVAGDDASMVRKVRIGQLQAAALTGEGLSKITPDIQALQIPMMLRDDNELDYVRRALSERIEAAFEAKGFKVLLWADVGWVHFFCNSEIVGPEDLKSLKVFTWAEGKTYEVWRKMGVHAVQLQVSDIFTALQSGMIDCVPTTPVAALAHQWFGLANHMVDMQWAPLVGAMVISTRAWERIPEELRPEFQRIARETGADLQREIRAFEQKAKEAMVARGLVVHAPSPENVSDWERVTRSSYPMLIGPVAPADIAADVERIRDIYRTTASVQ